MGPGLKKFTDKIKIRIKAGDGGPGAVSFNREKYVPRGGPDGGDGGKGGDVFIMADRRFYNLSHFFRDRLYKAEKGKQGMGSNRSGRDGEDLIMRVPPGTQVYDAETDELIVDLIEEDKKYKLMEGGIGGKGNTFFKSSTNQAPRFAQPGIPVDEKEIILSLKLIAEIGLVGLPNAGKSTLLSKITNATPKIGSYPFTTLIPNLGVIQRDSGRVYKVADIPGIIEGAHKGHGLGLSFLQHIERVNVILYLIDSTENDLKYNLELLKSELKIYNEKLPHKPYYIILSKSDLIEKEEMEAKIMEFDDKKVLPISSTSGHNIDTLLTVIDRLMDN